MAKKEKVPLKHTDDLEAIDQELDAAMAELDGANERVNDLLTGVEASVKQPDGAKDAVEGEPEETASATEEGPTE